MAFKKGDVVRLKSGSPKLTVESISSSGQVSVYWYQGSEFKSFTFSPEMLLPERGDSSVIPTDGGDNWA